MPQIIATSTQKIYWYILKILIGLSRFLPQASCNVLQHPGKDGGQRAKRAKLDPQSLRILCERRRVRSSKAWDMMINMNRHPAVPLPMTNGNFIRNSRSFVQSSSFSGAVPFFFQGQWVTATWALFVVDPCGATDDFGSVSADGYHVVTSLDLEYCRPRFHFVEICVSWMLPANSIHTQDTFAMASRTRNGQESIRIRIYGFLQEDAASST